eukprot:scaffold2608_cov362-Prasinococcus_capsulatus_cf.AAC.5
MAGLVRSLRGVSLCGGLLQVDERLTRFLARLGAETLSEQSPRLGHGLQRIALEECLNLSAPTRISGRYTPAQRGPSVASVSARTKSSRRSLQRWGFAIGVPRAQ